MLKKTLTAAVAALTLAGASLTTTSSAQAGGFGKFVAAGILGVAAGAILSSRSSSADDGAYRPAYRDAGYGDCGYRNRPVFDQSGNQVGVRRVPTC